MLINHELIVFVGLPASGKTTVRSAEYYGVPIVSPDSIRFEIFKTEFDKDVEGMVWFAARTMVKMLLIQGKSVVLDATNLTVSRRKEWIDLAKDNGADAVAVFLDTPFEECVKRNEDRDRVVPMDVMERMRDTLEIPTEDEGFDRVIEINPLANE